MYVPSLGHSVRSLYTVAIFVGSGGGEGRRSLSEVTNVENMKSGLKYHKAKTDCRNGRINLYTYFHLNMKSQHDIKFLYKKE